MVPNPQGGHCLVDEPHKLSTLKLRVALSSKSAPWAHLSSFPTGSSYLVCHFLRVARCSGENADLEVGHVWSSSVIEENSDPQRLGTLTTRDTVLKRLFKTRDWQTMAQTWPAACFINTVSLEHSYTHLFLSMGTLQHQNWTVTTEIIRPVKPKISGPLQKKFVILFTRIQLLETNEPGPESLIFFFRQ